MLDHVTIGVRDIERSKIFYDTILRSIGVERLYAEGERFAGYSIGQKAFFRIGQRDTLRTSTHIAFAARNRELVDDFHRVGIIAGGSDNGAPGLRPHYHPNYYGAFILDPDGHNIEAVCHLPVS
ncbi:MULTISPECIES: VOC family protein [unclassified Rhizobium]|uniref:VOC family protein n=1 Tax=Rhizobium sp. AB2/73 TaxID=2795216 RepID=UPI0009F37A7A|nr:MULTISPECIES: VOC family protein [unclassified Rhizobium]QYA11696.1 VOC family protein [Rhizobium sp. AB2/73]UEQ82374.1 VOC family protein [Rhizobium sp. AB2/73]